MRWLFTFHNWLRPHRRVSIGDGYITGAFANKLGRMARDAERAYARGELGPDLGSMTRAERNRLLFGDEIE